jgi:hypothetical protein
MRKLLFTVYLAVHFFSVNAQVVKVEHFNAQTTHAPDLFELFRSTFKLPVVFDYQEFGNFSSGGIWLGNITLELANYRGITPVNAIFKGIALEPVQHTDTIVRMLDDYGIMHGNPAPARFMVDNVEKTYWTNIVLKDLTADNIRVFICDYTDRSFVNNPKRIAKSVLNEIDGGPLGIMGLKKIVISASNPLKTVNAWTSIPGAKKAGENHFSFFEGPEIVIEKAEKDAVKEITVQVRSVENATKFLTDNHMLAVENTNIMIDPEKLFGLRIILQQ